MKDYKPDETREDYVIRRDAENMYAKFLENPPHPTVFVQRRLNQDELFDKLYRRKWWRNPEGKRSFV